MGLIFAAKGPQSGDSIDFGKQKYKNGRNSKTIHCTTGTGECGNLETTQIVRKKTEHHETT
jgi:hypothetical protein